MNSPAPTVTRGAQFCDLSGATGMRCSLLTNMLSVFPALAPAVSGRA